MKVHPYAELYPVMPDNEFSELLESVRKHGLRFPVALCEDGRLIDGRHRWKACKQAEIEVRTETFKGDDAAIFQYIKDCNYHRRHLTTAQRARIASAEAQLPQGVKKAKTQDDGTHVPSSQDDGEDDDTSQALSQTDAAKAHDVSRQSVKDARQVEEHGTDQLKHAVFNKGTISLRDGAAISKEDEETQDRIAKSKNPKAERKKIRRERKEKQLGGKIRAAAKTLNEKRYGVILADPAWKFKTWSENGMDRSADNHYPTEETNRIVDLQIPAADDCVLFLWATAPMLEDGLEVLRAWGFTYRSNFVGIKHKIGTGYWNRNQHEHLLVGVKGNIPAPAPGTQHPSVLDFPVKRHSEKPSVHCMIDEMFPTLPKIELFARNNARGWDSWGAEAPEEDAA